jgi:hypothetical protein
MSTYRHLGWTLFGAGLFLLLLIAVNLETPLRALLALAFFSAGPGTAVVPHLRLRDSALAASLAIALSLTATVLISQAMVWMHAFSPAAAVVVLLALMAVALLVPVRVDSPTKEVEVRP